ncbi:GNAT family N-acetyltransferase [Psychroserpens sp. NJDZ02]|uniref:GNAT family N-acetyltransferase n=1 Tax=Psychroserpens sp. NJDZ02 TaxID=2570561 RepID=UPI001F0FCFC8|nr:GNAT family N-acetyltransferase [Psychroserpens sp. NJDZ02]
MEYHKDRFNDFSLLVFKGEKLVAILPANKVGDNVYSHQGLTYGGLVFKENVKFNTVLLIFRALLKFLSKSDVKELQLKMLPSIYNTLPNDEQTYIMFLLEAKLNRRDALSVVDYRHPLKFSKNRLEGVKKGEKHGLVVEEEHCFESFWSTVLEPNLSVKHNAKPVHSLAEIKVLKTNFGKQIRQFNVYQNDQIIAGTTIFESKYVAHAQYISSNNKKNELGSLDFLHHHLITSVFNNKRFFDFGISNVNNGRQVNQGLQYWKEGFGARTVIQDFYTVATNSYKILDTVLI